MSKIIEIKKLNKYYKLGKDKLHALKNVNIIINQGDFVIIMGKSGSGKTTLLNLLGLLDSFNDGKYIFNGEDVSNLNENQKSDLRNEHMGFIFQQFHLINSLSIGKNVELPLLYKGGTSKKERNDAIEKYLDMVGLAHKKNQLPLELSGGQQQRVAIARALINNPYVIFADEPTGALDSNTSTEIMEILKNLNEQNKTIIMVTHDDDLIKYANKVIRVKDGVVLEEVEK
ncbi:ABC transporter ATP-binding protein [Clostridium tarantellae]|uniref:ATP-binding cassette domain-containing protein n=1 Tax=Clostridium tarantellae TaxID=39493 RepID=A0A6I1MGY6_9CLOT|nr:ABC transporter ATP-binding protein [Clostridium tarantellae]MPQ42430.1 ATP-binding cassette domain-containing protein [Clostridium tarantellae]